jgi:hypothetical protein
MFAKKVKKPIFSVTATVISYTSSWKEFAEESVHFYEDGIAESDSGVTIKWWWTDFWGVVGKEEDSDKYRVSMSSKEMNEGYVKYLQRLIIT